MSKLFRAAMLHDCGVSKTQVHSQLLHLEWEHEQQHCSTGAALLKTCSRVADLAPIVQHHHTRWSKLKHADLPVEIKLSANCIYLADRVDVLSRASLNEQPNILLGRVEILEKITAKRGEWFAPELVDAFIEVAKSEAFWLSLESEHIDNYMSAWLARADIHDMTFAELRSLVQLFSQIVDAKSPFTKSHSDGVANLARHLGNLFALPQKHCDMLELAGLLHDIGKLRQPDELLDKPGRLTAEEFSCIQRHSFDTYAILKSVKGFETIALWAAQHHERADGSGYPYHLRHQQVSLEARIIAVSDVFQALAQDRPYRDAMPVPEIMAILGDMVKQGKLDAQIVARIEADPYTCWRIATGTCDKASNLTAA